MALEKAFSVEFKIFGSKHLEKVKNLEILMKFNSCIILTTKLEF